MNEGGNFDEHDDSTNFENYRERDRMTKFLERPKLFFRKKED